MLRQARVEIRSMSLLTACLVILFYLYSMMFVRCYVDLNTILLGNQDFVGLPRIPRKPGRRVDAGRPAGLFSWLVDAGRPACGNRNYVHIKSFIRCIMFLVCLVLRIP